MPDYIENPPTEILSSAMVAELGDIVGPQWVLQNRVDKLAYNNDCWPGGIILSRGRQLFAHQPAAIVQPANKTQITQLIQWAIHHHVYIVPFGAGSGVCQGAVANQPSIIIDLKRLNKLLSVDTDNLLIDVQSGILGIVLERELYRLGFTLGHYPSSLYCSSLGGYLATRSAGQYSSKYGKIEDMVVSMHIVNGCGESLQTTAQNNQLFVGSEGTLGLITSATLRIHPRPTHRFYRGFRFADLPTALAAIRDMMQQGLKPATVRLYDNVDSLLAKPKSGHTKGKASATLMLSDKLMSTANKNLKHISPRMHRRADLIAKHLLARSIGQPLALNTLANAFPPHCLLILGFEGISSNAESEAHYAFDLMARTSQELGPAPGLHWLQNRFNVSYKMSPLFDSGAFVDTMEVSTTWQNILPLYHDVRRALSPYAFVLAHFSHLYAEGSSIYFTFAGFAPDLNRSLKLYHKIWSLALDTVAANGASIAHHHGVGKSKAHWTHHDHTHGQSEFKTLKSIHDPANILNPGTVYPIL